MTDTLDHVRATLADAVVDDAVAGVYRANRRIFTDEEVFKLEMEYIFEGNWIYLTHESQVPNPGDYFTVYMGRQPVVITRDRDATSWSAARATSASIRTYLRRPVGTAEPAVSRGGSPHVTARVGSTVVRREVWSATVRRPRKVPR